MKTIEVVAHTLEGGTVGLITAGSEGSETKQERATRPRCRVVLALYLWA